MMDWWQYALLAGAGAVAGFVNVMAGGGSLLTMPVMIFMGMSPALANGTNRVALVMQNATAAAEFRSKGFSDFRLSATLALCTIPGAIAGAVAAVHVDPLWFKRLLAAVMVVVLFLVLRRKRRPAGGVDAERHEHRAWAHLGMVGVGFYGGFIQAGVGFILMAILRGLLHLDLVRVNSHKVFVVGVYMIPSLLVFALLGQVRLLAGIVLGLGTAVGGWLAARAQIKRGEGIVRIVFALAVVAMAARLLLDR